MNDEPTTTETVCGIIGTLILIILLLLRAGA